MNENDEKNEDYLLQAQYAVCAVNGFLPVHHGVVFENAARDGGKLSSTSRITSVSFNFSK